MSDPVFHLQKTVGFILEERHPDRFVPRYSMVMFHTLPYSEAKRRGVVQKEILNELTRDVISAGEVDFERARELVETKLDVVKLD